MKIERGRTENARESLKKGSEREQGWIEPGLLAQETRANGGSINFTERTDRGELTKKKTYKKVSGQNGDVFKVETS